MVKTGKTDENGCIRIKMDETVENVLKRLRTVEDGQKRLKMLLNG